MIQPSVLHRFIESFEKAGFDPRAFMPSYGMAEVCVGLSFVRPSSGLRLDRPTSGQSVGRPRLRGLRKSAWPAIASRSATPRAWTLDERKVGRLYVRGPSVMPGYFPASEDSTDILRGWLARYWRPRLLERRRNRHHRPGKRPHHRQRPQHLAAGHRVVHRGDAALAARRRLRLLGRRRGRRDGRDRRAVSLRRRPTDELLGRGHSAEDQGGFRRQCPGGPDLAPGRPAHDLFRQAQPFRTKATFSQAATPSNEARPRYRATTDSRLRMRDLLGSAVAGVTSFAMSKSRLSNADSSRCFIWLPGRATLNSTSA